MSWPQVLRRILVEKRVMLGVVAVVLLMDVGLYAFVVYPLAVRVENVGERANVAERRLAASEAALQAAHGTMEGKARADAELQEFYGAVIPQGLARARGLTYPHLSTLARRSKLVLERRSSSSEEDENGALGRLRTTMLLAGEYRDIRRFVFDLERSPEFIVIDEVVLSRGQEIGSSLVLALGVSTYYRAGSAT